MNTTEALIIESKDYMIVAKDFRKSEAFGIKFEAVLFSGPKDLPDFGSGDYSTAELRDLADTFGRADLKAFGNYAIQEIEKHCSNPKKTELLAILEPIKMGYLLSDSETDNFKAAGLQEGINKIKTIL